MNKRIKQLAEQAGILKEQSVQAKIVKNEDGTWTSILEYPDLEKFAELIAEEFIRILETEIELVKGYKSTACNDLDIRWHEGKIEHFIKIVEKSKKHFGVEE